MGHRHWLVASGGPLVALPLGAGTAAGYIDPDPIEVQSGVPATLVQHCGDTALRWIEVRDDGATEPEHPAPRVNGVGEPPPSTVAPTTELPAIAALPPIAATVGLAEAAGGGVPLWSRSRSTP